MLYRDPARRTRPFSWPVSALGVICLLALFARLHGIEAQSIWFDEAASVLPLRDALADTTEFAKWAQAPHDPVMPRGLLGYLEVERKYDLPMVPAYFTIQYYWACLFGTRAVTLRILPILFGCLTIPLVYGLARRCLRDARRGRLAGIVAAACCAFSTLQIYHSQGVRMYAMNTFLCACSLYTLLLAARTRRVPWWAANIAVNMLLIWTHQFSAFFVAGEGVWLAAWCAQAWASPRLRRRRLKTIIAWLAIQSLNIIPMAAWMRGFDYAEFNRQSGWRQQIHYDWDFFVSVCRILSGYTTMSESGAGAKPILGLAPGVWFAVLFLTALTALVVAALRSPSRVRLAPCLAIASGTILPVLTLYTATLLLTPCFLTRYVVYASLGYYVLAGIAAALPRRVGLRLALAAIIVGSYIHQAYYSEPGTWRHDWISVARYIAEKQQPSDRIAIFPHFERRQLFVNSDAFRADQIAAPTPYERRWIYGHETGPHTGRADPPDPADGREMFDPAVPFARARRDYRWVVLTSVASVDVDTAKFEERLKAAGVRFEKRVFGRGWAALTVYHLPGTA